MINTTEQQSIEFAFHRCAWLVVESDAGAFGVRGLQGEVERGES
jgi:hypothetical protein